MQRGIKELVASGRAGDVLVFHYSGHGSNVPDDDGDEADTDRWLASIDVAVCLRWPSGGETSASWLRCLAAGRATITTDLVHTSDVASLDPRTWLVQHTRTDAGAMTQAPTWRDAVSVRGSPGSASRQRWSKRGRDGTRPSYHGVCP